MATKQDQLLPTEDRVCLAVKAYQQGIFKSIRQAAEVYNVAHQTVSRRLNGIPAQRDTQMKNRKLSIAEETALTHWILSMDERGMAPTIDYTRPIMIPSTPGCSLASLIPA